MPNDERGLPRADLRLLLEVVDGGLAPAERTAAEARLRTTAEGRRALAAHRRVAGALRGRGPSAPDALRRRVAAAAAARPARRRLHPGLAVAGLAALALVLAVALPGALRGDPSIGQAALPAARAATQPTPAVLAGQPTLLDRAVEGVPFPRWDEDFGWHANGARTHEVGGRRAETVFYEHQGHRIGYTIVSGPPLEIPDDARRSRVGGVSLAAMRDGHRDVLVFERGGHTCILAGHVLHADTLVKLATWEAGGAVTF